jgi:hypothetical protein
MYSPKVIREKQSKAESRLGRKLVRHTIQEVEFYNKHFDSITEFDKYGEAVGFTRELLPDELEYIENERELCPIDFLYLSTRYFYISDRRNKIVRFSPNIGQRIALDVIASLEILSVAVILMFLKARQLGVSTLSELLVLARVLFTPNVKAIVGSSDPGRSDKMSQMFLLAYQMMPWWLKPRMTRFSKGEFFEFSHAARLDIQWGNKKTGIGRGSTPTIAHLSELAEFENPKELVDASLVRAIHEDPDMLFIAESTANGVGDWWHDTWLDSVRGKADNSGYFYPIFLPWYVGRDLYPTEARERRDPVPDDWEPPEFVLRHAEAARENVQADPLLRKHLGSGWRMSREQMWYYMRERERFRRKGQLSDFYKELPATAQEAFTVPFGGIFDTETLIEMQDRAAQHTPRVYAITGPEIKLAAKPQEIDQQGKRIAVTVNWSRQYPPLTYVLVPLHYTGHSTYDFNNKLTVWEMPLEGEEYVCGVDTSHGQDRDSSVITVHRKWTPERLYNEQVCVFASNQVNNAYMWPFGLVIGTLYATLAGKREPEARYQPKFAIEIPQGRPMQDEMRNRGWWNMHHRASVDSQVGHMIHKFGWSTDRHSRHDLMTTFGQAVMEGHYRINSTELLREMGALIWNSERKRLEAKPGAHDDYFFSAAIGWASGRQMELVGSRSSLYVQREIQKQDEGKYPEFDAGDFGRVTVSTDIRRRL